MDYSRLAYKIATSKLKKGEIAKMAGISENTISNILKNESTTIETLEKISKVLGINMAYWWEETSMVSDKPPTYSSNNDELIKDLLDDKRRYKARIDELESTLAVYEGKKKEAASG